MESSLSIADKIDRVLRTCTKDTMSFTKIMAGLKESFKDDLNSKQLTQEVMQNETLKSYLTDGKKSLRNPHYVPSTKVPKQQTAKAAQKSIAKTDSRPQQQSDTHLQEEVKQQAKDTRDSLVALAIATDSKPENEADDKEYEDACLLSESINFNEELLHDQYRNAFSNCDWMRYLKEDLELCQEQFKGSRPRMAYVQIFMCDAFCDEEVRLGGSPPQQITHISLKMVQAQKTPSMFLREVQQSNLKWLCQSLSNRDLSLQTKGIKDLLSQVK